MPRVTAIVPAAGIGARFGAGTNKPLALLEGLPLLGWVLRELQASARIDRIVPVSKESDFKAIHALCAELRITKAAPPVPGGAERQHSVHNALMSMGDCSDIVLVHDGVRPLLTGDIIERCLEGLAGYDGAIAAVPPKDTIKEAAPDGSVLRTPPRATLWSVQTPQVFPYLLLRRAYDRAGLEGFVGTDDASLVERIGGRVRIVMGAYENIKVTTPEDLELAEVLASRRQRVHARG